MKKLTYEQKYNLRFFSISLFLSTSIALTAFNTYKLNKESSKYLEELEINRDSNKDLHISSTLDEIDKIINDVEEIEEPETEVELFEDDSKDYYDLENSQYVTDQELLNTEAFTVTVDNKTYEYLPESDFDLFTAVVAAESSNNKYDALAVASSILNRCDSEKWVNDLNNRGLDGENPIDHIIASGQYSVYSEGNYEKYLNGNAPDEVTYACQAAWYNGIRNNNYCSFRGKEAESYSNNQIVENGNRFDDEVEVKKIKLVTYK